MGSDNSIIRVGGKSRPPSVAGAIAKVIREHGKAEVQAIGAGAVNQAIKAAAIARNYLEQDGITICCVPYFSETEIEGNERTAIRLKIQGSKPPDDPNSVINK